ncbi:DUF4260 family protein [Winogradskyella sp. 3972H.M.0a.05]|uniref:DUF4260 domain-containing protein n=1 Tax=Winogradskyella sp. 3972H.M.0a.05 TaxID=2950277 RepID=UPI003399BF04
MKLSIKIEELAMFLLGVFWFELLGWNWWWFIGLFFVPDISMLGYLVDKKIGAWMYNVFHHKAIALAFYIIGTISRSDVLQLIGIILFSHAAFDRCLGYGLKYEKGFKYTHLGEIGNSN